MIKFEKGVLRLNLNNPNELKLAEALAHHPLNATKIKPIIMWHIYKNSKGLFEVAQITKGRYQIGSNQGYERKAGCLSVLRSVLKSLQTVSDISLLWQDDTLKEPKVFWLFKSGKKQEAEVKPVKKYVPHKRTR